MKLPKKKRGRQLALAFDSQVQTFTVCTATIGDFFEEATLRLFGGVRFTTESNMDYCPDIALSTKRYLEVKGTGRSGRVIVYNRRLEREIKWCETNKCSIEYVIWSHNTYTKDCANGQELIDSLASTTSLVMRVPIQFMHEVTSEIPVRLINRWNLSGYTHGWTVPITKFLERCNTQTKRKFLRVDRQLIRNFTIHTHDPSAQP